MDYKDLRSIQETYNAMYSEEVEDIQELDIGGAVKGALKKGAEFMDKNPVGKAVSNVLKPVAPGRRTARPSVRTQDIMRQNQSSMEEVDVFDIVKGHLIDEGATESEAIKAMLSMTEEEINAIVEGAPYVVTNADKAGNTKAYQGLKAGKKNAVTGKPMYVAAPHLKGV